MPPRKLFVCKHLDIYEYLNVCDILSHFLVSALFARACKLRQIVRLSAYVTFRYLTAYGAF